MDRSHRITLNPVSPEERDFMFAFRLLLLLTLLPATAFSQKKTISMEDIAFNKLRPDLHRQIQWLPGSLQFSFVTSSGTELVLADGKTGQTLRTFPVAHFSDAFKALGLSESKTVPMVTWVTETQGWINKENRILVFSLPEGQIKIHSRLPEKAERIEVCRDLKAVYTQDNGLYYTVKDSSSVQIARGENPDINFGKDVHQREFGIEKGIFLSPGGTMTAFYRSDDAGVTKYPFVDLTARPAVSVPAIYPMAGMTNQTVTIGLHTFATGKTVYLQTGEPADQYLTNITWSPDEKWVYVAHVNRDQNHMRLIRYSSETGKPVNLVFEEKDSIYTEPQSGPVFIPGKKDEFLWKSPRDGWAHFYWYSADGKLTGQVTSGNWTVVDPLGFDEKGRLIFSAVKESPLEKHVYRTALKSGKPEKLTLGEGTHLPVLAPDGNSLITTFTSLTEPGLVSLIELTKLKATVLHTAANPVQDYDTGKMELVSFKGPDSTVLFARIVVPENLETGKKYPVILYVYGGPHLQQVTQSWQGGPYSLWAQYIASQGFIVLMVDNRGTPNRGKVFEQKTFRKLGTLEIEDQMAGLEFLFSRYPQADRSRVGVFGWSYGGFMTASLMTRMPDRFKAGVSGAPVIDWSYYETVYTERYMDTPQQNPSGYKVSNVLGYVKDLKGRLLMIHGTSDPTVMWQHSLLFVKEAATTNTPLDYFVYPGHLHGIAGKDRLHLWTKITRHLLDNL